MVKKRIDKVLVLGGGSAGLLAALAIKKRTPAVQVRVVASSKRGVIGVGEGTVPFVLDFIHNYLGFDEAEVYKALDPVYKLGVRFDWGKREYYDYTFATNLHNVSLNGLKKVSGFYVGDDCRGVDLPSALMGKALALPSRSGRPDVPKPGQFVAWHLENKRFVTWLQGACRQRGIKILDEEVGGVEFDEASGDVKGLRISSGATLKADLFIDSSGFVSKILGEALEEPFVSYADSLYCDRALVGGWERELGEDVLPYTVSETMDSGWCWRIDHPERINRGYVYSSKHVSDEDAEREMLERNPKMKETRLVKFKSGRRERAWVKNVVGIGNAMGFVEPLEATAIMCAAIQAKWLADGIYDSDRELTGTMRDLYNRVTGNLWDETKDFLALHYRLNDKLDTPFWRQCRNEVDIGGLEDLVVFYKENGPSPLGGAFISNESPYGVAGYYAQLVGMNAPCDKVYKPSAAELAVWGAHKESCAKAASQGVKMLDAREVLMSSSYWTKMRR